MKQTLIKNDRGNVAILFAIALPILLGSAGAAVEFSRWNSAQADLYAALDTAVLAGTKVLAETGDLGQAKMIANDYFDQSISLSEGIQNLDISFKLNDAKNGLAASGNAELETSLLKVLGVNKLPLVSPSEAELVSAVGEPPGGAEVIEVSMMLDITGSMCNDREGPCTSGAKVTALKNAARSLVEKLLEDQNSPSKKKIALVPFSTRIRVAEDGQEGLMGKLTGLDKDWKGFHKMCVESTGSGASETAGTWTCHREEIHEVDWDIMPCVTDRYFNGDGFGLTDAAPGPGNWLNAHGGDRMTLSYDSSSSPATTKVGNSATDPSDHWNYNEDGSCADISNAGEIVPLTDNKSELVSAINSLSAYGSTAGVLGTAFTWYTLSPNWEDIWGGSRAGRPYSELTEEGKDGAKKLRKIAVLMTDGAYNTYRGWKDQDTGELNSNAIALCSNMKALGIEIFTVGFELGTLSATDAANAQDVLSQCATDAQHYIDVSSSTELVKAFDNIGSQLVSGVVRLTK